MTQRGALVLGAALLCSCGDDVAPPVAPADPTTGTESGGSSGPTPSTVPADCPDQDDPECTTNAGCGNDESCIRCECVNTEQQCPDPRIAECLEDRHCPVGEMCESCLCISEGATGSGGVNCEGACDPACETPLECLLSSGSCACACPLNAECIDDDECQTGAACIGCECVGMACADGTASPIDPAGDVTTQIVVAGTAIVATLTGDPGACPEVLCTVAIDSVLDANVSVNAFNMGDVNFQPDMTELDPLGSITLDVVSNACDMPTGGTLPIFFYNNDTQLEIGRVDVDIMTMLP